MIVDLGCMRTVAGTTWINRIVPQWKEKQWFIKVVPEAEQFRFGDGQVVRSKFAVLLEVAIAGIHGVLRISVAHGTCPPLLSKPVCSALGLVIDTASHTVSSRRFGVKGYGLEQSKGGHYVIPINDFGDTTAKSISSDFVMQEHKEIVVMSDPRGSAIRDRDPDAPSSPAELAHVQSPEDWRSGGLRAQSAGMGKRGAGQRVGRDVRPRGRHDRGGILETSDEDGEAAIIESHAAEANFHQSTGAQDSEQNDQGPGQQDTGAGSTCFEFRGTDEHGTDPSHDGANAGDDDGSGHAQGAGSRGRSGARSGSTTSRTQSGAREDQGQGEEDTQGGEDSGPDGRRSTVSFSVDSVLGRPHDEPHDQPAVADSHVQMEASPAHVEDQARGGGGEAPVEAQSQVDYEAARQPHCKSMGPPGSGKAAVLFPKGGLAGTVMQEETSTAEQEARRMDRLDLVMGTPGYESAMDALHVVPDYEIVNDDGGQSDDEQGASASIEWRRRREGANTP